MFYKQLGITAGLLLVFGLAACSNTTSANDEDNYSSSLSSSVKSSSSTGTTSSSSSVSSSASSSTSAGSSNLGTVSGLTAFQNATETWILAWTYAEGSVSEKGFQIDKFNESKNTWEVFDSVGVDTYRYVFAVKASGTFRVSAYKDTVHSSYSSEVTINGDVALTDLSAPSSLTAARLAPSVWLLSWNYTTSLVRRESGFILEKYNTETQDWAVVDTLAQDVNRVVLDSVKSGTDISLGSYRVAAYDNLGRSDYSNDVSVSIQTAYDSDIVFKAPTGLVPNVVISPIVEIVIPTNPLNKTVEQSEYTKSLNYEIIWVEGDVEATPITFSYTKNSVALTVDAANLCNSYGRIRLVWTDENGIIDYSEWSVPTGSKPGTNTNLVDNAATANCPQLK